MTIPAPAPYRIVDLNYISLYIEDSPKAVDFYSSVFGPPQVVAGAGEPWGWRMGATWLTVFPGGEESGRQGNPRNTEFAIQVAAREEVDALYAAMLAAGAQSCMAPRDTTMYEPMRFACVDDPFGVRIDMYCPAS